MDEFDLSALPVRQYAHPTWTSDRWQGFEPRAGDILICTPYKSGTTWMQMICALLVFQSADLPGTLSELSPWIEIRSEPVEAVHARLAAQRHRRFIKTHTPLDGLPWLPQATYLCVFRDPRDVFMSMLNHLKIGNPYSTAQFKQEAREAAVEKPPLPEDPNELFRMWLTKGTFPGETDGAPFWSLFRYAATFWAHRHQPNIHFFHYGDMKADLDSAMRRVAEVLQISIDEAKWPALVAAAGFESMKQNADRTAPEANFLMWKDNSQFFNKGSSGQWQGVLSAESLALLDQVTAKYPADLIRWLFEGGEVA